MAVRSAVNIIYILPISEAICYRYNIYQAYSGSSNLTNSKFVLRIFEFIFSVNLCVM